MPNKKPKVPHYDRTEIQPIDFMESWFSQPGFTGYVGFLACNVIKYVCRFVFKKTPLEDLVKAQTYLGWLIEYVKKDLTKTKKRV